MFPNILLYLLRKEMTGVAALLQCFANLRGADVQQGGLHEADVRGEVGGVYFVAGTRVDKEVVLPEEALVVVPAGEELPVVATDEEGELSLGVVGFQGVEGVHHVGGAGEVELEVGGVETGVSVDGQAHHLQAEVVVEQVALFLQGVMRAHQKPYFVQLALLAEVVCQGEVSEVDGVEGSTE
jgi:hypothetical protein